MKIAVIGSNMVDLTSYITRMPVLGETLEAPDFSMGCGGKGANQAVAAAKYGADVLMMTKVGDDSLQIIPSLTSRKPASIQSTSRRSQAYPAALRRYSWTRAARTAS